MTPETVLITDASSGIGKELARCFAADGSRLVLVARSGGALEALADELRKVHKTDAPVLVADLAEPEAPTHILRHLQGAGLKVDVLVNNAGFGAQGRFAELPVDRQMQMVQVNVTSLTHLTRLLLPGMIERRRGGVLNVASTAAFQPGPHMAVYYATKAYVLSFSEALSEEVAGTGVTVTALCPGPTETGFGEAAQMKDSRLFRLGRMSAQEVAEVGHQAFRRGRVVVVPGLRNRLLAFSVRLSPRAMARKIAGALNKAG
jgi:uncharacterized protein